MKLYRILAVARKEFLHVGRDRRSLMLALAMPMILVLLFGYALTLDVNNVPLAVWDQSNSPPSRELRARFKSSRYFALALQATNYREIERAIDRRDAMMALVIPADFADLVESGRPARVQVIVDGSDSNTATIASGYADAVVRGYSQDLLIDNLRRQGSPELKPPVDFRPRVWFNADLQSRNFIVPGLTAIIMMVIAALLTSLTVAREWETGTMEQLISTPIRGPELILGKLLPYFCIGFFDVVVAVIMGEVLFHVPLRGSLVLLFGVSAFFLAGALSLGMLVSITTKSQMIANELAMLLSFLPAFLLSGFIFPIANMPKVIQLVTWIVPARYFIALLRGIYLKGIGLEILGVEALLLVLFGVAVVAIASSRFRKKLD
jgi:ABC-2 type transport system permease protein